jgi:hypothetical protein
MSIETIFYLPNRFRQTLITNSSVIDCKNNENLLLGIMK